MQIGAGTSYDPDWLCTDLRPRRPEVVRMDATERFPLPDASLDYIHAEHMIEHVSWSKGQDVLAECRRVLKPGGVVRLATPDLARLISIYTGESGAEGEHYLQWARDRFFSDAPHDSPVFLLNNNMRAWGHTFLYDEDLLLVAMADAGLVDIVRCELGESNHQHLSSIERHHSTGNRRRERAVRFETMVFEGTNP